MVLPLWPAEASISSWQVRTLLPHLSTLTPQLLPKESKKEK